MHLIQGLHRAAQILKILTVMPAGCRFNFQFDRKRIFCKWRIFCILQNQIFCFQYQLSIFLTALEGAGRKIPVKHRLAGSIFKNTCRRILHAQQAGRQYRKSILLPYDHILCQGHRPHRPGKTIGMHLNTSNDYFSFIMAITASISFVDTPFSAR